MNFSINHGQPLRFGTFELHVGSRELRNGSTSIRLQEQPFEILRMMLERAGDVVTREELQHRLWPNGTFVDFEHSLNAAVKRLRAALGDDADNPRFVETLPRRGYRFIGALRVEPPAGAADATDARVRLAVLPFVNLSEDSAQEYFTDGLTEEMISQLGRLCRGRIGVIARWSSMLFKGTTQRAHEIGEALRADYLLEGSVRREGDRVRITARLIETRGETNLWAETYERNLTDYLSVQADVAARIARSLAVELVPEDSQPVHAVTKSASAYQSYLLGRYHWNLPGDDGVEQALIHLNESVRLDPQFAPAYAGIARALVSRAENYREQPRRALEAARDAAKRAIELEPDLSEGHLALGEVRRMLEWDWRGAETAYSQAIALNPSQEGAHRAYALLLASVSRSGEAGREAGRACELDPFCLVVSTSAAWVHYLAGDFETAKEYCRRTIDLDPRQQRARRILGAAYLGSGQIDYALDVLQAAQGAAGDEPVVTAWLAHARAVSGDRNEALKLIEKVKATRTRYLPSYHVAIAYAGLGDADAAFQALERAATDADPALAHLAQEPRLEPVRTDPRYGRLVELLGI